MSMPLIAVPKDLQTAAFLLGSGALKSVPELLKTYFPGKTPWIIADGNTWEAAGKFLHERMKTFCASGIPRSLIYARSGMEIE